MVGHISRQSRSTLFKEWCISKICGNLEFFSKTADNLQTLNSPLGSFMDKPSIHRLVGLVYHTIPTFGHAHTILEIPFETITQTLKQSMERNPHTDKHISGFYHTIWTDSKRRIVQQLDLISAASKDSMLHLKRWMAVLLLGKDAIHLKHDDVRQRSLVEDVFQNISRILKEPLCSRLFQYTNAICMQSIEKCWMAGPPSTEPPSDHVEKGIHVLNRTF